MKLKFALCCLFFASAVSEAAAADAGLRYIQTRGVVRCGTDLSAKTYAYKDADGYWRGIDADLCRTLAAAVLGDKERIEMVNVTTNMVSKYLTTNKIDVMLGGAPYSAGMEISSQATPVDVIYYDKQMFLARNADKAGSMEDYRGQKVCVVNNSEDQYNLEVSSPGLDRPLTVLEHFQRFAGYDAKIETSSEVDARKRFKGKIISVDDRENIHFDMDGKEWVIPFAAVSKAKLLITDELLARYEETHPEIEL